MFVCRGYRINPNGGSLAVSLVMFGYSEKFFGAGWEQNQASRKL